MTEPKPDDMTSLLDTPSPPLTLTEVETLAREVFGLIGQASELSGERDRNYHLHAGSSHFVLKVGNPAETRRVIDFQTQALLHVARVAPDLPVPRVIPTLSGAVEWILVRRGETPRVVRVLSYLQGDPFHRAPPSRELRFDLGCLAAKLDLALRGFGHPGADHELLWDLKHASRIRNLLVHISDAQKRAIAERFLDAFEANALPRLADLRAQVIHNDLNPHNVLLSPGDPTRIAGIIDFGDMVQAPLIDNLAVAAAYQLLPEGHPLAGPAEVVMGYHRVLPLETGELDILYDLIMTRMVLTVTITAWRAALYPENALYIMRNNPRAWAGLERCAALDRSEAQDYLREACQGGMHA